jgi:hypothetical protein
MKLIALKYYASWFLRNKAKIFQINFIRVLKTIRDENIFELRYIHQNMRFSDGIQVCFETTVLIVLIECLCRAKLLCA